jgi:hypothetical protein
VPLDFFLYSGRNYSNLKKWLLSRGDFLRVALVNTKVKFLEGSPESD